MPIADNLADKIATVEPEELREILESLLERIEELEERQSAPPIRMGIRPSADR